MAFTTINTGARILADHVTEIQDAWQGVSGRSNRLQVIQVSDVTNYAVDVRNLDSTYSYGLRVRDESSNTILTANKAAVTLGKKTVLTGGTYTAAADLFSSTATWNNGADTFNGIKLVVTNTASAAASRLLDLQLSTGSKFSVDTSGNVIAAGTLTASGTAYIGDTANAKNAAGLTVNQAGNDDEILSLKSSDVAHGMTDDTETDTYGFFRKAAAASGGLVIYGFRATGAGSSAAVLAGATADAATTTKSTTGHGVVVLDASVKSGTGRAAVGADGNLVAIDNEGTTRFIFDSEGSAHADVEWTTYDDYDDLALLNGLEAEFARRRDPVKAVFGEWLAEQRNALQAAKIVNFYDPDGPRAMVNTTRLTMLLVGALRQMGKRLEATEARLALNGT